MALFTSSERVAVGLGPERVRLLVARRNGGLKAVHTASAELPAGALRSGLRAPAFADLERVRAALDGLVAAARADGHLKRRPEMTAMVIPDAGVKMAATPLQGGAPGRAAGDRMARWALRELLPVEPEAMRVSWATVVAPSGPDAATASWLVSVGADDSLVRDHEGLLEVLGWSTGRVIPWTLAAGMARPAGDNDLDGETAAAPRELVLCDGDGSLACLFAADSVPRMHRTWRARVPAQGIARELPALQRYVMDHLEMEVDRIRVCGDGAWLAAAVAAADSAGLEPVAADPEAAMLGALAG